MEPLLDETSRHMLMLAMLQDVIAAVAEANQISHVLLVTDDKSLAKYLPSPTMDILAVKGEELNEDLIAALQHAQRQGAHSATVVLPDLPLLTGNALDTLIQRSEGAKVVLAPDWRGSGTNVLYLRPPRLLEPHFGPDSFRAHLLAARSAGLRVARHVAEETALDLDDAEAVARFLQNAASSPIIRAAKTFRTLSQLLKLPKDARSWTVEVLNRVTGRVTGNVAKVQNDNDSPSHSGLP